jgi:hypothetical protein
MNPYGYMRSLEPAAASRDTGPGKPELPMKMPVDSVNATYRDPGLPEFTTRSGGPIGVVKLLRARGGCLGVIRRSGVEGCEKSGGAAQRAPSPEYPSNPGN